MEERCERVQLSKLNNDSANYSIEISHIIYPSTNNFESKNVEMQMITHHIIALKHKLNMREKYLMPFFYFSPTSTLS